MLFGSVLQDLLNDDIWSDVLSFDDVNDSVECFTLVLRTVIDLLVSLRKIRVKRHVNPWAATTAVIAARRHRDKLYRRALYSGNWNDWQLFRRAHNDFNRLLRSDLPCGAFFIAKFWSHFRYLSSKGVKSSTSTTPINFNADAINDYFLSILSRLWTLSRFLSNLHSHTYLILES